MIVTRVSLKIAKSRILYSNIRNNSTLMFVDHDNKGILNTTLSTLTAASKLGGSIDALVLGRNIDKNISSQTSKLKGVSKVFVMDNEKFDNLLPEDISSMLSKFCANYTHVVAPSTNTYKNIIPRIAAQCDCNPLTDVSSVEDSENFLRPMYAGNAIAKVKMTDKIKFLLIRTTSFDKAVSDPNNTAEVLDGLSSVEQTSANSLSKFISETSAKSDRPDLGAARVVVSGGRGMKSGENFAMLEKLADNLGGAVGASRAAVDSGFISPDKQVGQTGRVVAPDLYIAVGISGAIQHMSGMKDSKVIVAINKDKEAPIFQVADYGIVDDLFKVIPEMNEKLKKS